MKFYRNQNMTGPVYHRLLQYQVFPELRQWNGGTLDRLMWQQVKFSLFKVSVTENVTLRTEHPVM